MRKNKGYSEKVAKKFAGLKIMTTFAIPIERKGSSLIGSIAQLV